MSLSLRLLIEPGVQVDSGGRLFQRRRQRRGWQRGRRLRLLLLGHCILFLRNRCPQFHRSPTHCLCLGNRTDGHGSNRVPSTRRYMNYWHLHLRHTHNPQNCYLFSGSLKFLNDVATPDLFVGSGVVSGFASEPLSIQSASGIVMECGDGSAYSNLKGNIYS